MNVLFVLSGKKMQNYQPTNANSVANLGFPRGGGADPQNGGANLLFGQKFPENCMKMKEFGPRRGGVHPWRPP